MKKIFLIVVVFLLHHTYGIAQTLSGVTIDGNANPTEGTVEIYTLNTNGQTIPTNYTLQWNTLNCTIIAQNINSAIGAVDITVKWNFNVSNGFVQLIAVGTGVQITKNVNIISLINATQFCNTIIQPVDQIMVYGQPGTELRSLRNNCQTSIGAPYTFKFQWQVADEQYDVMPNTPLDWQDLRFALNETFTPYPMTGYGKKHYRRLLYVMDVNTTQILNTITSNAVACVLNPPNAGQIFDTREPTNANAEFTSNYPGSITVLQTNFSGGGLCASFTYDWERSIEGGPWTAIGSGVDYPLNNQYANIGSYRIRRKLICGYEEYFSNILTYNLDYTPINTENKNYVRENSIAIPNIKSLIEVDGLPIGDKFVSTAYVDGLGRNIQSVETGIADFGNNNFGDIVSFTEYDALGRADKSYLPYATTTDIGKFKSNPEIEQQSYLYNKYNDDGPYYSQSFFEASPLGRVINTKAAGKAFGGMGSYQGNSLEYDLVSLNEFIRIWDIGMDQNVFSAPITNSTYEDGKLFKLTTINDKNKKTITYTDFSGKTILTKVQIDDVVDENKYEGWACTYYVYDDLGRQRYIITPKAVEILVNNGWDIVANLDIIKELCYYTEYDEKGRVIISHRPGTGNASSLGEVHTVYDNRDRVVLTQDEKQRSRGISGKPQWSYLLYDELNRPVVNGLVDCIIDRSSIQNEIDQLNNENITIPLFTGNYEDVTLFNPILDQQGNIGTSFFNTYINTITYYDEYNFPNAQQFDTDFQFPSHNNNVIPQVSVISKRIQGNATGSKTRILNNVHDDLDPFNDAFLTSTTYYNEDGIGFQTIGDDVKGELHTATMQYDYNGLVLSTQSKHNIKFISLVVANQYNNYKITSRTEYDKFGKAISGFIQYANNPEKELSKAEFDEMGTAKRNIIAPGYNNTTTGNNYMESMDYSYNIQGMLTGINKEYALQLNNSTNQWDNYFAMFLGYDNLDGNLGALSPSEISMNGQLTGTIWRTQGDNIARKNIYQYDNANRYIGTANTQREKNTNTFTNSKYDFSVSGIKYDLNGNIESMQNTGVLPGSITPTKIDDLTYNYAPNSNKLLNVTENAGIGSLNGKLYDFVNTTLAGDQYSYDENGNLINDLNKNIFDGSTTTAGITYNFLDKPEKIIIDQKSTIEFLYDATGGKIAKTVTTTVPSQPSTTKTTWYIGGFVIEENTTTNTKDVQYISSPGGRLRLVNPAVNNPLTPGFIEVIAGGIVMPDGKIGVMDYMLNDNLGSNCMILTEELHIVEHNCTMENASTIIKDYEEANFGQSDPSKNEIKKSRDDKPIIWTTNTSAKVAKLGGLGINTSKVGPNMLLKVMAGDRLDLSTRYFYKITNLQAPNNNEFVNTLSGIVSSFINVSSVSSGIKNANSNIAGNVNTSGSPIYNLIQNNQQASPTTPNAWLSWLYFDENFNFVPDASNPNGGLRVAAPNANGIQDASLMDQIRVPQNGYVLVYLSNNDAAQSVFFDDFKVTHTRGQILEENHYYAFGQKIHGIGGKAIGKLDNKFKYQGSYAEEEEETGWNEFELRMYNPTIGRWNGLDPYDEFASGYTGMGNDPVNNFDVDGGQIPRGYYLNSYNQDLIFHEGNNDPGNSFTRDGNTYTFVAEEYYSKITFMNEGGGISIKNYFHNNNGYATEVNPTEELLYHKKVIAYDVKQPMYSGANQTKYTEVESYIDTRSSFHQFYVSGVGGSVYNAGKGFWNLFTNDMWTGGFWKNAFDHTFSPYAARNNYNSISKAINNFSLPTTKQGWGNLTGNVMMAIAFVGPKSGAGVGAAKGGYSTMYRAVSKAELDDIAQFGFRTKAGGYETGKLFAPTFKEAAQFGKNNFMFDGIPNTIMKVRVPNNVLNGAYKFGADGMNAISIPANQLNLLKGTPINFSPWLR